MKDISKPLKRHLKKAVKLILKHSETLTQKDSIPDYRDLAYRLQLNIEELKAIKKATKQAKKIKASKTKKEKAPKPPIQEPDKDKK